jgi:hypothetical protein
MSNYDKEDKPLSEHFNTDTAEEKLEAVKEVPKEAEPTVSLTKDELQQIIKEAKEEATIKAGENLTQLQVGEWSERDDSQKVNKTARMKLYQKDSDSPLGLIIDWKHLRFDYDETTRQHDRDIYKLTVLYEDDVTEDVEMPLLDFARINNFETVELIDSDRKVLVKKEGKVRKAGRNREGYVMGSHPSGGTDHIMLGDWIDVEVERIDETHTIRRPNGDTLKVHNNRLNA